MARRLGRFGFGSAAGLALIVGLAAFLWFGGRRSPYLLDGIPAAERKLRSAKLEGNVLRKGARVLQGMACTFHLSGSNMIEGAAFNLEQRAMRNEMSAGIELQLEQCRTVVTNCGTRDDAEDFARRLRVRGIQAVVSWPRGDQRPNWPKDPYRVKVSSFDRARALELLSQSRAFPPAHSDSSALALSVSAGEEDVPEPAPDTGPRNEVLFDNTSLRLSIGKRESNMTHSHPTGI
jgi:hypothetical protein